jgi:hypothetical protein
MIKYRTVRNPTVYGTGTPCLFYAGHENRFASVAQVPDAGNMRDSDLGTFRRGRLCRICSKKTMA